MQAVDAVADECPRTRPSFAVGSSRSCWEARPANKLTTVKRDLAYNWRYSAAHQEEPASLSEGISAGLPQALVGGNRNFMSRPRTLLFGMLFISTLARAGTITLDFEAFADSTSLTNQYVGFLFTNPSVF